MTFERKLSNLREVDSAICGWSGQPCSRRQLLQKFRSANRE
jgi:hypothetical protein